MRRPALAPLAAIVMCAAVLSSCSRLERPPYGGEKESALAAATVALDLKQVQALLTAGADPNKMIVREGHYQSPWALALRQLRPRHPEHVQIIRAMLKSGA